MVRTMIFWCLDFLLFKGVEEAAQGALLALLAVDCL